MNVKALELIDIVLTVYNQEKIVARILEGIFRCTITPFNLIIVFDACKDKSKENALEYIDKRKPSLLRNLITRETPDFHETKSNNVGLRLACSDYVIMLQDDMEIKEKGWEIRMTFPMRKFSDIAIVGSRGAFDIVSMSGEKQIYSNGTGREFFNAKRNIFAVRDCLNRGPIAFDRKKLEILNFLDERFAPCNLDDTDICLRAWTKHAWKSGLYWIDYYSPEKWSKTKQTPLEVRAEPRSRSKNAAFIAIEHAAYLSSNKKHSQNIILKEKEIDYPEKYYYIKTALRIFISQIKYILNTALFKIKRLVYRVKIHGKSQKTQFSHKTEFISKN